MTGEEAGLGWASNAELLHLGLESSPFHTEFGSRAGRTTDSPVRLMQRLENMFALGLFEGRRAGVPRMTRHPL